MSSILWVSNLPNKFSFKITSVFLKFNDLIVLINDIIFYSQNPTPPLLLPF